MLNEKDRKINLELCFVGSATEANDDWWGLSDCRYVLHLCRLHHHRLVSHSTYWPIPVRTGLPKTGIKKMENQFIPHSCDNRPISRVVCTLA